MRWLRKESGENDETAAAEARQRLTHLRESIAVALHHEEWNTADTNIIAAMKLLRETSSVAPVTQSTMAELHGQWGLALNGQRRYDEAYKHLIQAERLFNMDHEQAIAWADSEGIRMEGEGDELDLSLALAVLSTLAEATIRQGQPGAGEMLMQVVEVADMAEDEPMRWESRLRLATFMAGMADWASLMELGRELGAIARERRSLPHLLEAMRQITEAQIGLENLPLAIQAQTLVVDIARYLKDATLADEEAELQKLINSAG
jgi:hypothetical protein